MKETRKYTNMGMIFGMPFGMSFGTVLGNTLFDNMPIGLLLGMSAGMGIGIIFGQAKDKAVNLQLVEKGYKVTKITPNKADGSYQVMIEDVQKNTLNVVVSKAKMKEEVFELGNIVYLNEDGELEQAYEK